MKLAAVGQARVFKVIDLFHNGDQLKYYFMCISISLSGLVHLSSNSKNYSLPNKARNANLDAHKRNLKWRPLRISQESCSVRLLNLRSL